MDTKPLFSYRGGNSLIHKMPALLKLCLLLLLPTAAFFLPLKWCLPYILFNIAASSYAGFSPVRQLKDLKPILYYAVFLAFTQAIAYITGGGGSVKTAYIFNRAPCLRAANYFAFFLHNHFTRIKASTRKNPSEKNIAAFRFVFSLYSDPFFGMGANGIVVESARREKFPEKTLCFAPGLYFRSFF